MWKAIILAVGLMALILGFESLFIDSAVLYSGRQTAAIDFMDPTGVPSGVVNEWRPSDWIPWALLSSGAITVIYSFLIPRRLRAMRVD